MGLMETGLDHYFEIGFLISCDGQLVNRVTSVKYLGLLLDENMSGYSHAIALIKKCAGRISFLYRHADVLNFQCRKLFSPMFYSYYALHELLLVFMVQQPIC